MISRFEYYLKKSDATNYFRNITFSLFMPGAATYDIEYIFMETGQLIKPAALTK